MLHAILFELLANVIIAFSVAHLLGVTLAQSGTLSVASAVTAMLWNYIFNVLFDRVQKKYRFTRNLLTRMIHAGLFELFLIIILLPVTMIILRLSATEGLLLEFALVLFFLPYTLLFNWSYDQLRWQLIGKKNTKNY